MHVPRKALNPEPLLGISQEEWGGAGDWQGLSREREQHLQRVVWGIQCG